MGNPTYPGLELVQAEFRETAFPLPEFRTNICTGIQLVHPCGLPIHKFTAGTPADLHLLAKEDPCGEPQNVALCAENGHYGLRFVEECFLRDVCAFDSERQNPSPSVTMRVEPYGSDEFLAFVHERSGEIADLARYGKTNPSIRDWFMLLVLPERYVFPGHIARVA